MTIHLGPVWLTEKGEYTRRIIERLIDRMLGHISIDSAQLEETLRFHALGTTLAWKNGYLCHKFLHMDG